MFNLPTHPDHTRYINILNTHTQALTRSKILPIQGVVYNHVITISQVTCIHTIIHSHTHIHIHTLTHSYSYTHTKMHTPTYTQIQMETRHTYIHTHWEPDPLTTSSDFFFFSIFLFLFVFCFFCIGQSYRPPNNTPLICHLTPRV